MTERDLIRRVAAALRGIEVGDGRDLISSGKIRGLVAEQGAISFHLLRAPDDPDDLARRAEQVVREVEGVRTVDVTVHGSSGKKGGGRKLPVLGEAPKRESGPAPRTGGAPGPGPTPSPTPPRPQRLAGVAHVIAVSSGKGGVGKSTVATNLAAALAQKGQRVGLMDADVYGPDIPIMFGAYGKPRVTREERVIPLEAHGVKLMSIGFLIEGDTPAIWRGPIVMGILRQFLQQVDWGELDYLIVDMPPGTGDAQLSLVQLVQVDGAVLVTTPQGVATADVLKAIKMFERVEVPVLGLIENMSGFACPHCGEHTDLFGSEGGRKLAATAGVPFLGEVPLGVSVVRAGDTGQPTVISAPETPEGRAFTEIADRVAEALEAEEHRAGATG